MIRVTYEHSSGGWAATVWRDQMKIYITETCDTQAQAKDAADGFLDEIAGYGEEADRIEDLRRSYNE